MNPPPLPDSPEIAPGGNSVFRHCASGSLVVALLVVLASAAYQAAKPNTPWPRSVLLIASLCAAGLLAGGIALAIVGLCGIRRHGPSGLLGKSLAGLVINAVLLFFVIGGLVTGIDRSLKSRQARQDLRQTARELQAGLKNSFDPEKGITNFNREGVEEFQRKLYAASSNLTGDEALVMQASAAHIERMQVVARELETVAVDLRQAHILDFSDVSTREDLQSRHRIVQRFAEVNQKLINVITNSETLFSADLKKLGVSSTGITEAVTGFHNASLPRNSLLLQIRGADARVARSMCGVLELLEDNWGYWKIDETTRKVQFTRTGLVGRFNQFFDEIRSATEDEINAERRLVNMRN